MNGQTYKLPGPLTESVKANLDDWRSAGKVRRLWQHDASLWTKDDEANWLGWLDVTEEQIAHIGDLRKLAEEAKAGGFTDILLLGMGGSSLCPEVFAKTFGRIAGSPQLHVLDSTDPAQIKAFDSKINPAKTLFVVSSKSGSTLEPNIFKQYFFERTKQTVGADKAGSHFIAITDPGLQNAESGRDRPLPAHFLWTPQHWRTLLGSVEFRHGARRFDGPRCRQIPRSHPTNGRSLRRLRFRGRKSWRGFGSHSRNRGQARPRQSRQSSLHPAISDLGAWLEQLLAESTGKQGKGIIPVDREELGAPAVYGDDRVFVYLRLDSAADPQQDAKVAAIEQAGHPVVRITVEDIYNLGQEFFRWEIATAVAGSILGINAFNQPDVEAAKVATRSLTEAYEKTGSLPAESPDRRRKWNQALYRSGERGGAGEAGGKATNPSRAAWVRIWAALGQEIILPCWLSSR